VDGGWGVGSEGDDDGARMWAPAKDAHARARPLISLRRARHMSVRLAAGSGQLKEGRLIAVCVTGSAPIAGFFFFFRTSGSADQRNVLGIKRA
jgi:hypothetical protein